MRLATANQNRAEIERHATAVSAALSQLASHIHDNDTDCPVCTSSFPPGTLKTLAETAAISSNDGLTRADETLEQLRSTETVLNRRISELRAKVSAPIELGRIAVAKSNALSDAHGAIARRLGVSEDVDLVEASNALVRNTATASAAAAEALKPLTVRASVANGELSRLNAEILILQERENQISQHLVDFRTEDKACADRITARNLSAASLADIDQQLTIFRGELEKAQLMLAEFTEALATSLATTEVEQSTFNRVEHELAATEEKRSKAESLASQIKTQWQDFGLSGEPDKAEYERNLRIIDEEIASLEVLAEKQGRLARKNEDTLLQSEIAEVVAAMIEAGGDLGFNDPDKYLRSLEQKLELAGASAKLTTTVRDAVKSYTEDLKTQADDFSNRVLDPLNVVIDDFNEAMLSTPGESIQFKADTRVDSTSFGMALRYREKVENAIESRKDLPPQVVLSEGQLAANGFSILCSASTAYPWSRWQALLLDDPLQHNDIIHTAAFIDVMRNMVELNGYQLIISSHDRGESDFISRKFDAAGLPCSTVLLTAPSEQGVLWDPVKYNTAASKLLEHDDGQNNVSSL